MEQNQSGVSFDENQDYSFQQMQKVNSQPRSKMAVFLIKLKLAKNEGQANLILIGITLFFIIATAVFWWYMFVPKKFHYSDLTPAEKSRIPERQREYLEKNYP